MLRGMVGLLWFGEFEVGDGGVGVVGEADAVSSVGGF